MSAIECKIIICRGDAVTISNLPDVVVDELVQRPKLANKLIEIQTKYIHKCKEVLSELTDE